MVVLFITDATFINSFIFTDSLTLLMRKRVKKKVPFRNVGSVDVHIIVGVSYTTVLISEVLRIHKHRKTCTFGSSS